MVEISISNALENELDELMKLAHKVTNLDSRGKYTKNKEYSKII